MGATLWDRGYPRDLEIRNWRYLGIFDWEFFGVKNSLSPSPRSGIFWEFYLGIFQPQKSQIPIQILLLLGTESRWQLRIKFISYFVQYKLKIIMNKIIIIFVMKIRNLLLISSWLSIELPRLSVFGLTNHLSYAI